MRSVFPITVFLSLASASPAFANQITQTLRAVQTMGDFVPFDISGSGFNSSLGVLKSVRGELKGTASPNFFDDFGPFPTTTLATRWFLHTGSASTGADAFAGALPVQMVKPAITGGPVTGVADYKGSSVPVDLVFNFGDPAQFIGGSSPDLLEFGFTTKLPLLALRGGGSDLTAFNGAMTLTYSYVPELAAPAVGALEFAAPAAALAAPAADPVPEPDSLLVFGIGILALAGWAAFRSPKRERAS